MANLLEIFVLIHGDLPASRKIFSITAQDSTSVSIWRRSIYDEAQRGLSPIDLILWKLKVPLPGPNVDQAVATLGQDLSAAAVEMLPTEKLSDHFPQVPTPGCLHVIVQAPAPAATRQLPPSPIAEDGVINNRITSFLPTLQTAINKFLERNIQLPLWEPVACSDAVRSHVAGLQIPKISTSSLTPSLLLHNLGHKSHDPQLAQRVQNLFAPGLNQRFLCNTSGSGKTRLLLEGLWQRWGLYFTARTQPEGIGSQDLEKTLEILGIPGRLGQLLGEDPKTELIANREVAWRHLLRVLYARVYIFRVFLRCAERLGGITEQHKSRWLLIQLAPETLLGCTDVFVALNDILREASLTYLDAAIRLEQCQITTLLGDPKLFCVLDEAQVPANNFLDYSLSDTTPTARRPILREIMCAWTPIFPALIVSGTGISMQDVETVIGSAAAKQNGETPKTITDLGAFDNEEDQLAYLKLYLPKKYLQTEDGKSMKSRVGYWLHGRHRFTATYISLLLQAGLESPHTVLNGFIQLMTNARPSDHPDDGPPSTLLTPPRDFDFSGLWKDYELLRQIAGRIFEYIFNGKPRDLNSLADQKLVEYGVARFVVHRDIKADEPLALLAATHHFNTKTRWRWRHFLVDGLSTSNERARGITLEQVGAYLLGVAFSSPRPLSDVFNFVGENDLSNETAELASIHQFDGKVICNPVSILSTTQTYTLGYSPRTQKETLDWIKDPQSTVFCFPADKVGADLILVLRLSDKSVLPVLVQFKVEKTFDPSVSGDFSTTPVPSISQRHPMQEAESSRAQKGKDKGEDKSHVAIPGLNQDLQDALRVLGRRTENAGKLSVLRVLVSHPATPDADTLSYPAETDRSHQLVATVDLVLLAKSLSEEKIVESLKARVMAATSNEPQRNRKARDGTEGGPRAYRGWLEPDT